MAIVKTRGLKKRGGLQKKSLELLAQVQETEEQEQIRLQGIISQIGI